MFFSLNIIYRDLPIKRTSVWSLACWYVCWKCGNVWNGYPLRIISEVCYSSQRPQRL